MSGRLLGWSRRLAQAGAGLALLTMAGCASAPPVSLASVPPVPAGDARIWFFRVFFPDDTQTWPAIRLNGQEVGYGMPGVIYYRDVPAGRYHVTVDTFGRDRYQSQDLALVPGEQQYIEIQSAPRWASGRSYQRPTYYATLVLPQLAAARIAETRFIGGS